MQSKESGLARPKHPRTAGQPKTPTKVIKQVLHLVQNLQPWQSGIHWCLQTNNSNVKIQGHLLGCDDNVVLSCECYLAALKSMMKRGFLNRCPQSRPPTISQARERTLRASKNSIRVTMSLFLFLFLLIWAGGWNEEVLEVGTSLG